MRMPLSVHAEPLLRRVGRGLAGGLAGGLAIALSPVFKTASGFIVAVGSVAVVSVAVVSEAVASEAVASEAVASEAVVSEAVASEAMIHPTLPPVPSSELPRTSPQTLPETSPQNAPPSIHSTQPVFPPGTSPSLLKLARAYFIPPRQRAPRATANSATRDGQSCRPSEASIEAIAPPGGEGLALSDRPAITLHLPPTSARKVALVFRNEAGTFFESVLLPIPQSSSLTPIKTGLVQTSQTKTGQSKALKPDSTGQNWVSFRLPDSSPGLPPDRYRWSLVVICGESIEPDDPTFMGWVERPATQPRVVQLPPTPLQRARWYGQNGYWYDLVAHLRATNP